VSQASRTVRTSTPERISPPPSTWNRPPAVLIPAYRDRLLGRSRVSPGIISGLSLVASLWSVVPPPTTLRIRSRVPSRSDLDASRLDADRAQGHLDREPAQGQGRVELSDDPIDQKVGCGRRPILTRSATSVKGLPAVPESGRTRADSTGPRRTTCMSAAPSPSRTLTPPGG